MSAVAAEPAARVTLATLVEWYRGTPDHRELTEWEIPPVYSPALAEGICQRLNPDSRLALIRHVLSDGSEAPISRNDVDPKAWDELIVGYQRWVTNGKPLL